MSIPAGLIWGLYGVEVLDFAVIIPSFFDLILFGAQMVCVFIFPAVKAKEEDKKEWEFQFIVKKKIQKRINKKYLKNQFFDLILKNNKKRKIAVNSGIHAIRLKT